MEKLTSQSLDSLIQTEPQGLAVTIYAPMHVTGSPPHLTENQIRFKNLLHAAIKELEERKGTDVLRKRLKEFMDEKLADLSFFEHQTPGLLICADTAGVRLFNLPVDTEEYVSVDDRFHLAPVMGLMQDAVEYYVLMVAQHNPVLYRGDMYGIHETDIKLPETVAAGLNLDEGNQKSEQSLSAGGSSLNTAGFNGRGGARNPGEEDRMRFFRLIDSIIMHNADRSLPLILSGIDSEIAEYRTFSKYPNILQKSVNGNYRSVKHNDLAEQSWVVIKEEVIMPKRREAIEHFERLKGTSPDRTVAGEPAIESAAEQGRVETLLLQTTQRTHDTIRDTDDNVTRITFLDKPLNAALNKLALKVASMSGQVVNLDASQMPGNRPAVATLRF